MTTTQQENHSANSKHCTLHSYKFYQKNAKAAIYFRVAQYRRTNQHLYIIINIIILF